MSRILACLALVLLAAAACADEVLDRARALVEGGDASGAYALLKPLEGERAGEP